jgi:hypothetical protein
MEHNMCDVRSSKGEEIAKAKSIKRVSDTSYTVDSQSGNGSYHVKLTTAEASGIKIEGENKWETIIQNAVKERLVR